MTATARRFVLERIEDVSGVSGTGIVAEGCVFSDGSVVLRWLSEWPTSVVWHDRGVESLEAVHGHNRRTCIVWTDDDKQVPWVMFEDAVRIRQKYQERLDPQRQKVAVCEALLAINADGREHPVIPPTAIDWIGNAIVTALQGDENGRAEGDR